MSIIAFASASNDPTANPSLDVEVDLSSVSLPHTVTIYGAAEDTSDSSATFSWAWTLLDGDGATLNATDSQNVELTLGDWDNARLHLVATNTATGETSETNVLLAPSSSFCVARVLSARHGVQKIAKGERGWQDALDVWADTLEASATSLAELSDVTPLTTGAKLNTLVSGFDAVIGGLPLHTHPGTHVDAATNTARGTVTLEGAWHTAGQIPKILVRERLAWTGGTDYSVISGAASSKIIFQSASANDLLPHVVFCAHEAVRVVALNVVVMDGGLASAVGDYVFDLCEGGASKLASADMTPVGLNLTGTISGDNLPLVITHTLTTPLTVSAGDFVGVALRNSPTEGDAGRVLQVTLHVERAI